MRKRQKRGLAALGIGVIVLAAAGGAFAYWTQGGSGKGSGTVGTTGTITLTGTFPSAQLYPGGSVPVTLTAANSGTSAVTVANVHTVVTTSDPACLAGDFSMPDVAQNNVVVPAGATAAPLTGGTLAMANSTLNQDACKSATLTLALSST
jgi:hypothetical protein